MAPLLAAHPTAPTVSGRKCPLTAGSAVPDIPSVALPTLDGMYPVSEEGPQGRQAARHDGTSARGQLTGRGTPTGAHPLKRASCSTADAQRPHRA